MTDAWTLRLLRLSYCAFIGWASIQTFLAGGHDAHVRILAGAEIAAILAFLVPALEIGATAILLAVYAIAALLTLLQGEPPVRFVFYAATALYIVWASRRTGRAVAAGA